MKLSLILALALLEAVSALQLHEGPLEQAAPAKTGKEDPSDPEPPFPMETESFQMTMDGHTYRYVMVKESKKFWEADKFCATRYRGRLASIHSNAENELLHKLACLHSRSGHVWIGATTSHLFRHVRYHWVDKSHWNYSNWAPGNPQIYWIYGKMCVALSNSDGQWKNVNCNTHLPFICKS